MQIGVQFGFDNHRHHQQKPNKPKPRQAEKEESTNRPGTQSDHVPHRPIGDFQFALVVIYPLAKSTPSQKAGKGHRQF
jgi:hypothetical protein